MILTRTRTSIPLLLIALSSCVEADAVEADAVEADAVEADAVEADAVVQGDPFLTSLDSVVVDWIENGYAIVGYDTRGLELGRISVIALESQIRAIHRYPRSCSTASAPGDGCADVFDITVNLDELRLDDVHQTTSTSVLLQRMQAMTILAEQPQPQPLGENLTCGLWLAGSTAGCMAGSATFPLASAVACAKAMHSAVCKCRNQAQKLLPDFDFDKICGD